MYNLRFFSPKNQFVLHTVLIISLNSAQNVLKARKIFTFQHFFLREVRVFRIVFSVGLFIVYDFRLQSFSLDVL